MMKVLADPFLGITIVLGLVGVGILWTFAAAIVEDVKKERERKRRELEEGE